MIWEKRFYDYSTMKFPSREKDLREKWIGDFGSNEIMLEKCPNSWFCAENRILDSDWEKNRRTRKSGKQSSDGRPP